MRKYFLYFFILYVTSGFGYTKQDNIMEQANQSYSKQDYKKAIELYKQVVASGFESSKLYYNLGNAFFKDNDITSAIYNYEKAKKLNPSDDDIEYNLRLANTRIVDKIDAVPEIFIKTWWNSFVNIFSSDNWAIITVVLFFIFFTLLLIYLFSTNLIIRKLAFSLSLFSLFMSLCAFYFANENFSLTNKAKDAIVFTPTVSIKSSPDYNSTDLFVIHEGLKVKITDKVNDWYEIRIANGNKGWLKITDVETI